MWTGPTNDKSIYGAGDIGGKFTGYGDVGVSLKKGKGQLKNFIEEAFKAYLSENELGFGKVGPGFRLAVTGMGMGPSMFEICAILGKEETLSRLNQALEQLP